MQIYIFINNYYCLIRYMTVIKSKLQLQSKNYLLNEEITNYFKFFFKYIYLYLVFQKYFDTFTNLEQLIFEHVCIYIN